MKKDKCIFNGNCNGHMVKKEIEYTMKVNRKQVIVPDVEVWECDVCKEQSFPYESAVKIESYRDYSGKFIIRTDPVLHRKLSKKAKEEHRSLNQEITHILEKELSMV